MRLINFLLRMILRKPKKIEVVTMSDEWRMEQMKIENPPHWWDY